MHFHYFTSNIPISLPEILISHLYFHLSSFYLSDGTSGDGSHIGNCPLHYSTYKCLSTGSCNVCGLISGNAEGCDINSDKPVCDADKDTAIIEDTVSDKEAKCVACKKSGNVRFIEY